MPYPVANCPALQTEQVPDVFIPDPEENVPGVHEAQVDALIAPEAVENCPEEHKLVQAAGRPEDDE
jgi:ferredoxin